MDWNRVFAFPLFRFRLKKNVIYLLLKSIDLPSAGIMSIMLMLS